jgi:hypothetical protein
MAEPNLPEAALPRGYEVATTVVTPLPAERAYPLKNADFLTLCDGTNGKERAGRDLHIGFFVSAIVGIIGFVPSVDWQTAFAQRKWTPILGFLALVAIAAASACGCVLHWNRMRREDTPFTRLKKTISDFFQSQVSKTNSSP